MFTVNLHCFLVLLVIVRALDVLHVRFEHFFTNHYTNMHLNLLAVKFGIRHLEMVPHPVDVPSFLPNQHSLHVLVLHVKKKLNKVYTITLVSYRFTLN